MSDASALPPVVGTVLLTDHPWPDTAVESAICRAAGYELIDAPPAADAATLASLAADVEGILTNWAKVTATVLAASPRLRVVSRLGVGTDNIDVVAARARGVVVTRVPGYCVEEVSDHAVALVLSWARGVVAFDRDVRAGRWAPGSRDLRRVRDLVTGIWGVGEIGLATAHKLAALGCTVLVDDRHPERAGPFEAVAPRSLLERVDVVSLHLPLTDSTRGIVDADALARMQPGSLLVNTSRGALVDVDALAHALETGRPGAAALDVLPHEPAVPPALVGRDDVVLTPHVGFSSIRSIEEVRRRASEDLVRVLRGLPAENPAPGA